MSTLFRKMALQTYAEREQFMRQFTAGTGKSGPSKWPRWQGLPNTRREDFVHHTRKAKLVAIADENGEGGAL